jgi:hypothetical protein
MRQSQQTLPTNARVVVSLETSCGGLWEYIISCHSNNNNRKQ